MIDSMKRDQVRRRADGRCEYCLLRSEHTALTHQIEHITAKQHGGADELDNLALACHRCNLHKGPNLSSIDPETGEITPLFHPRRDHWSEHFEIRGSQVVGLSPIGRAIVRLLAMNDPRRVQLRAELIALGLFP